MTTSWEELIAKWWVFHNCTPHCIFLFFPSSSSSSSSLPPVVFIQPLHSNSFSFFSFLQFPPSCLPLSFLFIFNLLFLPQKLHLVQYIKVVATSSKPSVLQLFSPIWVLNKTGIDIDIERKSLSHKHHTHTSCSGSVSTPTIITFKPGKVERERERESEREIKRERET